MVDGGGVAHRDRPDRLSASAVVTEPTPAALGTEAVERDSHKLLGQVMGFVAVTVGFAALGAYIGRDLSGGGGLVVFLCGVGGTFRVNLPPPPGRPAPADRRLLPPWPPP